MADAKEKLILLARQMVLCQSMPQIESWNWPRSATQRLRRQAMQAEEAAGEQCRRWAMAIKEIADALPKQQPAQNDAPCGTEKCPPGMVCKSPFCRAEQPAQGDSDCGEAGHAEGKCGNRGCIRKPAQGEAVVAGMTALYDLFGIGAAARDLTTLRINVENTIRRSKCLDAIEREFFTVEYQDTDPDSDGSYQDCPLSWAAEPAEYVEQLRALLTVKYPAAPPAPSVPPEVRGALTEARDIAMRYALEARIPECGHFGAIAQDLDYVCAAMIASGGKASVPDDGAKDAARYRWLRDVARYRWYGHELIEAMDDLTGAVDAAMLAAAPEPPR